MLTLVFIHCGKSPLMKQFCDSGINHCAVGKSGSRDFEMHKTAAETLQHMVYIREHIKRGICHSFCLRKSSTSGFRRTKTKAESVNCN